ncbi:MAG: T9SS type A sorting domain-containing protein [Bacteroidales bacterium]|nr:T9SS type A sorting domain-containing protein [Bacteroidales bacterium]
MKKNRLFLMSAIALFAGVSAYSQDAQILTHTAKKLAASVTINVDGVADDWAWDQIDYVEQLEWNGASFDDEGNITTPAFEAPADDHRSSFKVLYNDEGLYFLGKRTDNTFYLKPSDMQWDGHNFDQYVVYLNPYGRRDSEQNPFPKWEEGKGIGDCYWGATATMAKFDLYDNSTNNVLGGNWMDGRFAAMDSVKADGTYAGNGEGGNDGWIRLEEDYGQKWEFTTDGNTLIVEGFIPWSVTVPKTMDNTPTVWGFEVESIDNDQEGDGKKSVLCFNNNTGHDDAWYNINRFGTLNLSSDVLDPTSVNLRGINAFNVYPNPAQDQLYIDSDQDASHFRIYSTLGNVMMEASEVSGIRNIDISQLHAGTYILQLTSKKGNRSNVLFVKE